MIRNNQLAGSRGMLPSMGNLDRGGSLPGMGAMGDTAADLATNIVGAMYDILGAYPRANVLPYWYACSNTTAQSNAIAANTTVQNTIKISADAAFIATKITGASEGDYLVFIRIAGSDRQLMNQPIHSVALVGTAELPAIMPKPLLIMPNSNINFDFTDISGAENEVYFTLVGFKVYNLQQYGPAAN